MQMHMQTAAVSEVIITNYAGVEHFLWHYLCTLLCSVHRGPHTHLPSTRLRAAFCFKGCDVISGCHTLYFRCPLRDDSRMLFLQRAQCRRVILTATFHIIFGSIVSVWMGKYVNIFVGYFTALSVVIMNRVEWFDDKQMANWVGFIRTPSWLNLSNVPSFAGRLGKTTKNFCEDSRLHGRDANLAPPEHKSRASPIHKPAQNLQNLLERPRTSLLSV
jgi:hypothetical protein